MYFLCFRYECNTNSILLTLFPLCSYAICVHFLCASFSIVFFVLCTCFRCCSFLFSNQGADTDDIKCLLYVSSWNNPFFRVPRISTGITLSPPIDHGSRSLSLSVSIYLSIYMSVILIALSHAFCEVYAHTLRYHRFAYCFYLLRNNVILFHICQNSRDIQNY